jgi:hypothetical protein
VSPPVRGGHGDTAPTQPRKSRSVSRIDAGVRSALANALRQINVALSYLPPDRQEAMVIGYDDLDRAIDDACLGRDRKPALAAIEDFRAHWLRAIVEAAR